MPAVAGGYYPVNAGHIFTNPLLLTGRLPSGGITKEKPVALHVSSQEITMFHIILHRCHIPASRDPLTIAFQLPCGVVGEIKTAPEPRAARVLCGLHHC